ncbi:hypothetical protein AAHC03_012995 [Spirometra sp. Aus1]
MLFGTVLTSLTLIHAASGFCLIRKAQLKGTQIPLWDSGEITAPEKLRYDSTFKTDTYDCSAIDDMSWSWYTVFVNCCYLGDLEDDAPMSDKESRSRLKAIFF